MDKLAQRMLLGALQTAQMAFKRTKYTTATGVSHHFMAMLQIDIDLSHGARALMWKKKKLDNLLKEQKYDSAVCDRLGHDLAAAHFIVKQGGSVKFIDNERWYRKNKDGGNYLPTRNLAGLHLEMVDASGTELIYEGIEHFVSLKFLRFLSLRKCHRIDDWCLSRLHILPESLEVLDLSSCPRVTERGLASLHHHQNLKLLCISGLPQIENMELVAILVEEMLPNCHVIGVDYSDLEKPGQKALSDLYDESANSELNIHDQPFQNSTSR